MAKMEKKKEVFAQRPAPLSVSIKGILDEYPDGQILKELLQNAEDAGASELRLILDLRQFGKEKLYDERLSVCQGPALLAYNDAMFTKEDWKNIQKTQRSSKEMDSKKIGRFGIGFNSVYHLTDFPWILSGNMIGVFDPCERGIFRDPPFIGHPVGGYKWDLTDDKNEMEQFSDQFAPLKYEDFDPEISSHFNGTLFRFPLRLHFFETEDDDMVLSKETYNLEKIEGLFKAFKTDGDRLLLFLTSIQKVSLWICSDDNKMVELYSVRKDVQSTIQKPLEQTEEPCYYFEADITVRQNTGFLSSIDDAWSFTEGTNSEICKRWAIVQFISNDDRTTHFIKENGLKLLPWVGVACPLDVENIKTDGYVSCFLPLPPDKKSQTGLPIQVHGSFFLTKNRRGVPWPSDDNKNDPHPEWNLILANQLIPSAYVYLLNQIKDRNPDSPSIISYLWPVQSEEKPEWKNLIAQFYKQAENEELFWSSATKNWVTVSYVVFLDPNVSQSDRSAIHNICSAANKSIVSVPTHVPDHFKKFAEEVYLVLVSPEYICKLLKEDPTLLQDQLDVKKQLLIYVLSDCNCSDYLENVPLLPLADGSFVSFNPNTDPVYVSSDDHPQSLLPGLDSLFLSDEYCSVMSGILASGKTQLCRLQPKHVPTLLHKSVENGYWKAEEELEKLWQYITQNYIDTMDLSEWEGLSVIPILSEDQQFATCCVDSTAPVLSSDGMDSYICQWLKNEFGLTLAQHEHVPYLKHWVGSRYIMNPEPDNALKVICQVWKDQPKTVVSAVQKSYLDSQPCFLWFQEQILRTSTQSIDQNMQFLIKLPLFHPVYGTIDGGERLVSAFEAKTCYFNIDRFETEKLLCQIGFSFPLIPFDRKTALISNSVLINKLNLKEMSIAEFVSILLSGIGKDGYFSAKQKSIEMVISWMVEHFEDLTSSSATFHGLNSHLVVEQFKREVEIQNPQISKPKYVNFCALLASEAIWTKTESERIWTEICQLHVIPCAHNHFHCPAELVTSCEFKILCPYICEPADWVKSDCKTFLSHCQIKVELSLDDMVNVVRNIQKEHGKPLKPLSEETLKGFMEVMNEIVKHANKYEKCQAAIYKFKLPLPDSKGCLQSVDELLYNNLSTSDQSDYHVVHETVPKHLALYFGAKTLCDVRLEQYEDKKEIGEAFGPEVKLVERIKGILSEYHDSSDFFQEFLQNADDAGATKIAFFLDRRSHTTEGLLSEQYEELQDSAILIYNDSTFGDDDITGIQQVGVGSKAGDKEKIGHFGAGFSCAYQYTDCPSFISDDDVLCILDPMRQFFNKSEKPGRKFNLSCQKKGMDFRAEFSAVYNTYHVKGFPLKGGTMFRLPLRKIQRKLSLGKQYDVSEMHTIFECVADSIKKMMLFLPSVKNVVAYESDDCGNFKLMWEVQSSETNESPWSTKDEFRQTVHDSAKRSPSQIKVTRSSYELTLQQTNKLEEKWIICQRLGFEMPCSTDFSRVKFLPVAGVATQLDSVVQEHTLFCSLPLPQFTKMPVSINGHFFLDSEGRKNLFTASKSQNQIQKKWNNVQLYDVAVNAYLDLLEVLKININEGKYFSKDGPIEKIMKFWTFLPDMQCYGTNSTWSGAKDFSNHLFKMFAESDRCLFPCLTRSCNGVSSIVWLKLKINQDQLTTQGEPLFPSTAAIQLVKDEIQFHDAFILLHELGIKIVPCPPFILNAFADASVPISTAQPTTVASYLREPWINLTDVKKEQKSGNIILPCPLTDTVFRSEEKVLSLLNFLIETGQLSDLSGLPLLITCDKVLRYFSPSNPAKLEEDEKIQLFSEHTSNKFICKELRSTLREYLKKHHDATTVTALNLRDLYNMLPGEMLHQGIPIHENTSFCTCPNEATIWLSSVWSLIIHLITDESSALEFLKLFKNFYLIPAKMTRNGSLLLFRIQMRLQVVHPDVSKLISASMDGLPVVDLDLHGWFSYLRFEKWFQYFFFGNNDPVDLINCLVYWNWPMEVENQKSISYDLLSYFSKKISYDLSDLRKLPIFETFDGQFVDLQDKTLFSLDGQKNLLINGQNIWMSEVVFLKKHEIFLNLYKNLDIGQMDFPMLYSNFIIPSFPKLSTEDQVVHLRYLNERSSLKHFNAAIEVLKQTQFIQANNKTKKSINQFYDHTVPLFKELCSDEDFLPKYFFKGLMKDDCGRMQEFLHRLGLKHILKPEEHVKFAVQLSNLSLGKNLKKIQNGSKLILDSAAELSYHVPKDKPSLWNDCIQQMGLVAFIPSMKLDENLQSLFPSTTLDSVKLMKANGSIPFEHQTLVWTATRVLPDWVPQELYDKMGVLTLESRSCINCCMEHFKKLLDYLFLAKLQQQKDEGVNSPKLRKKLKAVLNHFYHFLDNLSNKKILEENDKLKLTELPLIIVEDGRRLAYPKMTVERLPVAHLKDTDHYRPFLYELPPDLHKYKALFNSLGLQQKPSVWHYATYLQKVYIHFHVSSENEPNWDPNVYQSVLLAQEAMVMSADETVEWDNIQTIYLLSSDGKLYKSCELVFRDNTVTMQKYLPKNTNLQKFWECSQNPAFQKEMAEFVNLLPGRLKLKLSSEVLSECLCDEKSEYCESQPCHAADRLLNLFSSTEFFECVQRLWSSNNDATDLETSKWIEIGEKLRNIQIRCYSKLIIEMKDLEHSVVIENTDKPSRCFFDGRRLLVTHEDSSQLLFANLTRDLQQFLSINVSELELLLLLKCSNPCELKNILDELGVPMLSKKFINLPVLGDHVPAEYIHFLEMHPLNNFRNGEYVAFLKSEERDEEEDAETDRLHIFIWAKIICCLKDDSASALRRHYKINIGDSNPIEVSALDLHKYMTPIKNLEPGPLVPVNIAVEPQSRNVVEEEACKIVTQILEEAIDLSPNEYQKVTKRLYLTYHPDKNTDDKRAWATVVFQHLQSEIHRLEKHDVSAGDLSFPSWDFYRSINNQTWRDYCQGRSQAPFHDFNSASHTTPEHRDHHKAIEYWKIANDDLNAAFDAEQCQDRTPGENIGNEHVIYFTQQAVEKALKAVLFEENGSAERTHNLLSLAKMAADSTRCSKDVVHYVSNLVLECGADISRLRYPEGHASTPHDTYTKEDKAIEAVDYARKIVEDLGKSYPSFKP